MRHQAISWRIYSTNVRDNRWKKQVLLWGLSAAWILAPARTAQAIKSRFFTPYCHPLAPEGKSWLKRGRPFRIQVGGRAIQAWEWGQGPGVLFVHGWNGRAAHFAPFFGPLLEAGCSVTAFDAPGHGLSNGRTSSYFQITDAVRTLLRKGSDRRLRGLVGHSLGGAAVIGALSREKMEAQTVLLSPALDLQNILYTAFERFGIPAQVYRGVIAGLEQQYGYTLEKDNPVRLLPSLEEPVLILHDRSDQTIPYMESRRAAEQNENVMLRTTEGIGHKRILADPAVVKQVVSHLTDWPAGSRIRVGSH